MATKTTTTTTSVDTSVEKKLKSLYQLQTLLSEIDGIKILRGELPLEVQDMEDEIEGYTRRVEKCEEDEKSLLQHMAQYQREIAEAESLIEKKNEVLNEPLDSRSYDAVSHEIEYQEINVKVNQKRLREGQAKLEEVKSMRQTALESLEERRAALDLKKSELDEIINETRAEEEKLREKAKSLELQIEPRLLAAFKRIRKASRNGLGIMYVQRDACGGCFNKIPPQRQLDIRSRKKIIVCEYCGRIMIDPELAGVQVEEPKEEKPKRGSRSKKI